MLGFARSEQEIYIRCSVTPQFSCLYLTTVFGRARKNSVTLWPEVSGLKVISVQVAENERALKFYLEDGYTLVFKFFGNRPNILLFREQTLVQLFNKQLSTDAELRLDELERPDEFTFEKFVASDQKPEKVFYTFGKIVHNDLKRRFRTEDTAEQKWQVIASVRRELEQGNFYLSFWEGKPVLALIPVGEIVKQLTDPIEALNEFYIWYQKTITFATEKSTLVHGLLKEKKQTEAYLSETYHQLDQLQHAIKNEEIGHILMANLGSVPPDVEKVTLFDFYRDKNIEVKLKKDLSAQKNAEHYYRKARNEKIALEKAEEHILKREERLLQIEEVLEKAEKAESLKALRTLTKTHEKESHTKSSPTHPFKRFTEDGFEIWVGKNAKNNDVLTQQFAHKEDLWLHARDCAGSHVIIKNQSGRKFPEHVIEKASGLAAWFSKRKNERFVPVIVTPRKFIRKAKGLPDGQVIVEKETVVMAEPFDPANHTEK